MGVNGVNLGYTKKGNAYQKSIKGRKVGTAIGVASLAGRMVMANKISGGSLVYAIKDFLKNGPSISDKIFSGAIDAKLGKNIMGKIMEACKNSKSARIGVIAGGLALATALTVGVCRLIGRGIDALINKGAKNEADRRAAQDVNKETCDLTVLPPKTTIIAEIPGLPEDEDAGIIY